MLKAWPLAFAAIVLASSAAAQLRPSTPEAIADAARDCWQAVGPQSVDQAKLEANGWQQGSISAGGKSLDTPLRVFGKGGSAVMLMIMAGSERPACVVTSRVARPEDVAASAELLLTKLQAIDPDVKSVRRDQSIIYLSLPRVATINATGSRESPATRIIVVGYSKPESK